MPQQTKLKWTEVNCQPTRKIVSSYSDECLRVDIISYRYNNEDLYCFTIEERIPYKGKMIVARYSLDNDIYNGTFYSLKDCQNFIEKLLDNCDYRDTIEQ